MLFTSRKRMQAEGYPGLRQRTRDRTRRAGEWPGT